ncbi:MAG: iron-sulfur cluster assembly accessory protein [Chloroflexi bacterium]|nr:iron-sulfur cluster assembly accessory protein [Chloroflexota bacterium]
MPENNPSLLSISAQASDKLLEILKEEGTPEAFLRITLAPGGHGGVQYMLGLETDATDEDTVIDNGKVKVLLDSDAAPLMEGTMIDYIDTLHRSGFVINNPNFASTGGCACGGGGCGCGGGRGAEAEAGEHAEHA